MKCKFEADANTLGLLLVMISFFGVYMINLPTKITPMSWLMIPTYLMGLILICVKEKGISDDSTI